MVTNLPQIFLKSNLIPKMTTIRKHLIRLSLRSFRYLSIPLQSKMPLTLQLIKMTTPKESRCKKLSLKTNQLKILQCLRPNTPSNPLALFLYTHLLLKMWACKSLAISSTTISCRYRLLLVTGSSHLQSL